MAKDIRRDTAGISPNNFVRPGVVDTFVGDMITAGVEGGLNVDKAIRTERLAGELDASRARFITGSPATADAQATASEDLDEEVERELAPLRRVLDGKKMAVEQGAITSQRFQLEADSIVQRHIAKRPGLAPEFRQMHAQYTGGALIEALTARETEMLKEHLSEGEKKAKAAEDTMKMRLEILKTSGYAAEAGLVAGNPDATEKLFLEKYEDIARFSKRAADADFYKATTSVADSQNTLEAPQRVAAWGAQYDLTLENIARSVRSARQPLAAANEEEFGAMVTEFGLALKKERGRLESERVALGLKPDDVSERMKVLAEYEETAGKFLDGSVALDQRKKRAETWMLRLEADLRKDAPLTAIIAAAEKIGGPTFAAKVVEDSKVMSSQTKEEWARFLMEGATTRPDAVTPVAGGMAASLLKDIFPQGTATDMTKIPALPAAVDVLANMGKAFAALPNDKFKAKHFGDWVREVSFYKEALAEKVPEEQRNELMWSVAMGAYKGIKVGMIQLVQERPSLKGQLVGNPDFGSDDPIAFKPGFKPSKDDQHAVDMANVQLSHQPVLSLIQSLAGYATPAEAGQKVWMAMELTQGQEALQASKRASTPVRGGGSGGSGSKPSGGRVGPQVGDVEDGYEFLGGDPSKPASWKKL